MRSPAGGLEVGVWTRTLGLVLEGQVHLLERTDSLQGIDLRTEVTFVSLLASLGWRHPLGGGLVWLGAGGGAVVASSRVSGIADQAAVTGQSWAPEFHGSVGMGWRVGPGIPFGELRLAWQADLGSGPVQGSVWSANSMVGYRFDVL